eukprot:Selendium_serpulae@DN6148_c0_g6_i3.p1
MGSQGAPGPFSLSTLDEEQFLVDAPSPPMLQDPDLADDEGDIKDQSGNKESLVVGKTMKLVSGRSRTPISLSDMQTSFNRLQRRTSIPMNQQTPSESSSSVSCAAQCTAVGAALCSGQGKGAYTQGWCRETAGCDQSLPSGDKCVATVRDLCLLSQNVTAAAASLVGFTRADQSGRTDSTSEREEL